MTAVAINRWLAAVAKGVSILLGLTLIVAVVINIVNVIGRYIFNSPVEGADEVEIFLMIGLAFFGALVAHINGRHLRMDVLARRFPPWQGRAVKVLEALVAVVACGVVSWASFNYTSRIWRLNSHSDNAHIPMWIPHSILTASFVLMTVVGAIRLFVPAPSPEHVELADHGEPAGHPELSA